MTLIATFQGKNCALLASDMQVKFIEQDQHLLPVLKRKVRTLVAEKFRKLPNGDYLAYNGSLNSQEIGLLNSKSLLELVSRPLVSDPLFRKDLELIFFYVSTSRAQIYAAHYTQPLIAAQPGQPFIAGDEPEHVNQLIDLTDKFRRNRKYNPNFLRELSRLYERYFLSAEEKTDNFGGFTSAIVSPEGIEVLVRNPGKLQSCPEAKVGLDGIVYFKD